MKTKPTVAEFMERLREHRHQIRAFGVKRLSLFGSLAKGEANKGSDADFLVEFEEGRGLFNDVFGLSELLEDITGRKVDLVKANLIREELRDEILRGVKIAAEL